MIIGIFSDTFLPIINGVGRISYEYALNLHKLGHEVHVITPCPKERQDVPFEINSFKARDNIFVPRYRTGLPSIDRKYRLKTEKIDFDILHTHSLGITGQEAYRLSKLKNIPLIGSFHTDYYQATYNTTHNKMIASVAKNNALKCCNRCTEVWPVSNVALNALRNYGYTGKTRVVRNGTRKPSATLAPDFLRKEYGLGKSTAVLLYVGEINIINKNLNPLFEVSQLLDKEGFDYRMIFVGNGKDTEKAKQIAVQKKLTNIIFWGHETDTDRLDNIYASSDVMLFPALYDTAGMVVYEAAACGTPSVVIEKTAPTEYISHGENGFVSKNNVQNLKNTIISAFRNYSLSDTGEKARQTLSHYWNQAICEVENHYYDLLKHAAKGR